jgi:G3E family GTPase
MDSHIPVTVLTGFLGSGKTTLLQRILHEQHGQRIAVIENELGQEGIDNQILLQEHDEQIVVMNNGCICCTVRADLVRILLDLARRRHAGELAFERVIVETTGLAAPAPVAQTFFMNLDVAREYLLDAVLTVVDAMHAWQQLDAHREAREQVAFADRLLVSKTDLASAPRVSALRERLGQLNPRAAQIEVHFGRVALSEILDLRAFSIDEALQLDPAFLSGGRHRHAEDISAFVFQHRSAFDPQRLDLFMRMLAQQHGADLLRYKGVLNVHGRDARVVFQGVHMLIGAQEGKVWEAGEQRASTLVFIGRDLPRRMLEEGLRSCLVDAPE